MRLSANFGKPSCLLYRRRRTCAAHMLMSAKGQKRTSRQLFDHLVRAFKQGLRHRHTKCLRGLEIDHKFVPCRRLHRKLARFLSFEDTIDVTGCAPILVVETWPIREQSAGSGKEAKGVDRR